MPCSAAPALLAAAMMAKEMHAPLMQENNFIICASPCHLTVAAMRRAT
jgi:hypothetical protein